MTLDAPPPASQQSGKELPSYEELLARVAQLEKELALVRESRGANSDAESMHRQERARKPTEAEDTQVTTPEGDVTERKRTEEALRQSERVYRAIGESIDYGIWICAPDGRNTYASASFLKLVGLTQEQCSSFGWGDVLHPDDAERTIAAWKECARTGGTWDIEHRYRGVDGQWHPILARGVPVRNERGELLCWAGINLDISRLKKTEAELREREGALEAADRQKNLFLAVLSHELRNPLTPIRNGLYILERAAPGGEQAARARSIIERQFSHLERLVNDLLDMTRIVSGKLRIERSRFDLEQMLFRTADDHRAAFANAGIELELQGCGGPVWLDGDEARLAQSCGNLLGNALKFTPPGGRVVLSLACDTTRQMAVMRVRDTGIGIHPDLLPRLFEPFVQDDDTLDRSKGGLGLGLALVKSVVELHEGTVTLESAGPGAGTEITVRLPFVAGTPMASAETGTPPSAPRRVLVIEDNHDAANSFRDMLEVNGHVTTVAYSGPEGLEVAKDFRPDVVFCDIGLPGMSGYAVAKAFQGDEFLRSVPLVALTGYALPEDQEQALAAGFRSHIAKPASPERLVQVLNELTHPSCQGS